LHPTEQSGRTFPRRRQRDSGPCKLRTYYNNNNDSKSNQHAAQKNHLVKGGLFYFRVKRFRGNKEKRDFNRRKKKKKSKEKKYIRKKRFRPYSKEEISINIQRRRKF
jgi:hypothetical protein